MIDNNFESAKSIISRNHIIEDEKATISLGVVSKTNFVTESKLVKLVSSPDSKVDMGLAQVKQHSCELVVYSTFFYFVSINLC